MGLLLIFTSLKILEKYIASCFIFKGKNQPLVQNPDDKLPNYLIFDVNGIKVRIYSSDYLDLGANHIDCIMIATKRNLLPHRGISTDIFNAAGYKIRWKRHWNLFCHCGTMKVTSSITTSSGNLKCRGIIHSVFPKLSYYYEKEHQSELYLNDLRLTILNCLEESESQGFGRICIAIGQTGRLNKNYLTYFFYFKMPIY